MSAISYPGPSHGAATSVPYSVRHDSPTQHGTYKFSEQVQSFRCTSSHALRTGAGPVCIITSLFGGTNEHASHHRVVNHCSCKKKSSAVAGSIKNNFHIAMHSHFHVFQLPIPVMLRRPGSDDCLWDYLSK
ncbi:hypothetical protein EVAR_56711_1 [Eumeta japonica]|uniref:Uncharacterized protein n=1 Tax=Eumeta variegata TaxID=151549 RepID=A0A4C1Y1L3_EUMVA|nr:hypothetical protein EVAR_56711_1 [Eumeta japonica]